MYDVELLDATHDAHSSLGASLDAAVLSRLILIERPLSAGLLGAAVLLLLLVLAPAVRKKREEAFREME